MHRNQQVSSRSGDGRWIAGRRGSLLLCLGLALGCGRAAGPPAPAESDLAELLPDPADLAGWSIAEGPIEHDPDTLWEYLDGGAPRYLTFGFRKLVHVRYQLGEDLFSGVTLDIYDMGSRLGAFGIYSNGRTPADEPRAWGGEGIRSGTVAAAWKESVFVHAESDDDRPELTATMERLVSAVCERIAGGSSPPEILGALPSGGLVPRSERYAASDLLGHAFLPAGVLATYELEGGPAEAFFSDLGNEAAAGHALESLRAHYSRFGKILPEPTTIGDAGFRFSDPGLGSGTAAVAGRYLVGSHGEAPPPAQERLLSELIDRLGTDQGRRLELSSMFSSWSTGGLANGSSPVPGVSS